MEQQVPPSHWDDHWTQTAEDNGFTRLSGPQPTDDRGSAVIWLWVLLIFVMGVAFGFVLRGVIS